MITFEGINPTWGELTLNKAKTLLLKKQGVKAIAVDWEDTTFAISERRYASSSRDEGGELYISQDGKWLIPADTVQESKDFEL